jgi:uncharacterized protein YjiS (DUF1127 family)
MFLAGQSRRRDMDHLLPRRVSAGSGSTLARAARRILQSIHRSREGSRQRRALALLSDEFLRDVGLTRHDVAREIARSFWRK